VPSHKKTYLFVWATLNVEKGQSLVQTYDPETSFVVLGLISITPEEILRREFLVQKPNEPDRLVSFIGSTPGVGQQIFDRSFERGCRVCDKKDANVRCRNGACDSVRYCSAACRNADRKIHKKCCSLIPAKK
jgi:hypothetical protein